MLLSVSSWPRIAHPGHTRALQRVWECGPGAGEGQKIRMVVVALVVAILLRNLLSDTSQSSAHSRQSQPATWNCEFCVARWIIQGIRWEKDGQVRKNEQSKQLPEQAAPLFIPVYNKSQSGALQFRLPFWSHSLKFLVCLLVVVHFASSWLTFALYLPMPIWQ